MKQPFFSILVPVYNVEKYLDECLESLTGQSFDDYEIVLVDDGSTDGSGTLCDAWQARFPETVRVLHQENRGLVMARSAGFRAARGRFFVIADSDDTLRRDALAVLHDYFTRYDADMVLYQISGKPDYALPDQKYPFRDGEVMSIASNSDLRQLLGASFVMNSLCSKAFSRELAEIERDFTPVAYIREGEDLMFSLPLADKARRIVFTEQPLYYYRTNPVSITNSYHPKLFRSVRDTLRIQRDYARKWDPSGTLADECDLHALKKFYDVIVAICLSRLPLAQKKAHLWEVASDEDFARCSVGIGKLESRKIRWTLELARRGWFGPLCFYGWLRRENWIPSREENGI